MSNSALKRLAGISRAISSQDSMIQQGGRITEIGSDHFVVSGLQSHVRIGERLEYASRGEAKYAKVLKVNNDDLIAAPYDGTATLMIGDPVYQSANDGFLVDENWLGRVVDPLGHPLDGKGPVHRTPAKNGASPGHLPILGRERVKAALRTGIRAIDIFTPLCFGQRIGIFAGSGVGKSTLLGMLAKSDAFDCVVVALIGERSREVAEFLDDSIGKQALAKTLVVVAGSNASALMRHGAPKLAFEAARCFREQGKRVLLLMDSATRFAHAARELATATGEPPVLRGYPAGVFADLPKLFEVAGPGMPGSGSITAIVTVLVDGDDHNEPISDAVRGILDGHIVLDRDIASQGRYPPIDFLASISRLANVAWTPEQQTLVRQLRSMIARYEETADMRALGATATGADPKLENAITMVPLIYEALCQSPSEPLSTDAFADLLAHLKSSGGAQTHEHAA